MLAAVLGSPVAHSLSPALHTAAYAALGLDGWRYELHECDEAGLPGFVAGLEAGWAGLSLTMPLKRVALDVATEVSPLAAAIGAANTLVLRDGRRYADNTDVAGVVAALGGAGSVGAGVGGAGVHGAGVHRAEVHGADVHGADVGAAGAGGAGVDEAGPGHPARRAVVLGAGGTAQAALAALAELGIDDVDVLVRSVARTGELRAAADRLGMAPSISAALTDAARASAAIRGADVVISTLPAGAADGLTGAGRDTVLLDVVYAPWPTPFAAAAAAAGARVVSGLEMLLHQAVAQVELMTLRPGPVQEMRDALDVAVRARA